MQYFDFKVGFSCNNNCIHCVVSGKAETPDLSTDECKRVIDNLSEPHIVGFTGGEPTIRKDFLELIEYAKSKGHNVALQTNGAMFSDSHFAMKAANSIDFVLIAIHSHNIAVHDEIVKKRGMGRLTHIGFRNIIKLGIPHQTQTVISEWNVNHLVNIYDFIQENSPGCIMNMTYPHPNGRAWENRPVTLPKLSEIKEFLHDALKKWARFIQVEAIPMCFIYPFEDSVYYNCDENIMLGTKKRIGIDPSQQENEFFNSDHVTENYNGADLSEKRKGRLCVHCVYNNRCAGVWKEYMEMYRDQLDIFPIRKSGSIIIYGDSKCMNDCLFCPGRSIPMDEEKKWTKFLGDSAYFIENGYTEIEISGGDPGEYKRLPEAIKFLKDGGVSHVQLSTHGRTLANNDFIDKLKEAGLDSVKVPLYGHISNVHEKVAAPFGSFDDAVQGIKNCVDRKILINGYTVVTEFNRDFIPEIILFYKALAGGLLRSMIVSPVFIAVKSYSYTRDWFTPMKNWTGITVEIIEAFRKLPESTFASLLDVPYCVHGEDSPYIQNETVFPDLGVHDVEKNNRSFENKRIPHYRIKEHFSECSRCILVSKCGGITKNELEMFGYYGLRAIYDV